MSDDQAAITGDAAALAESQRRYQALFDIAPTALLEIRIDAGAAGLSPDPDSLGELAEAIETDSERLRRLSDAVEVVGVNQEGLRLFEAPDAAAVSSGLRHVMGRRAASRLLRASAEAYAVGARAVNAELPLSTLAGRRKQVLIRLVLPAAFGESTPLVAALVDISERKRWEIVREQRHQQQLVIAELGQLALREDDVQALLEAVVKRTADTLGVRFCEVLELLPGGNTLVLRAGVGWRDGLVGHYTVGAEPGSMISHLMSGTSGPVTFPDLGAETRFRPSDLLVDHGVAAGVSALVEGLDGPFGILGAFAEEPRQFTRHEVVFLHSVATIVAHAVRRKRLEEARLETDRAYAELFDQSADAIALLDLDGIVQRVNRAAEEFSSYSARELVGRHFEELGIFSRRSLIDLAHEFGRVVAGKAPRPLELEVHRKDGNQLVVESRHRLFVRQNRPIGILTVLRDITERRDLERQLRHAQKMESIGRLAGGIAHDFNNLLAAIISFSTFAQEELPEADPARDDLNEVLTAADRASRLVQRLLAFSRRQIAEPRVIDVNALVTQTDRMIRRILGENIELSTSLEADLWPVRMDPGLLEQVLVNLVVNARDAMPGGGRLTLGTSNRAVYSNEATRLGVTAGEYVVLSVRDTGHGIPESVLNQIFEPFFTTKGGGGGTGLGLSTCYGIVKQARGHIDVESQEDNGSAFHVLLPRSSGDERPAETAEHFAVGSGPDAVVLTILVVEDEPSVRRAAVRVLKRRGYRVLEAADGSAALRICQHRSIDLLLTDVVMPDMDGPELAQHVLELRPDAKVLLMSGYSGQAIARHQELIGRIGTGLLRKPFTPSQLINAVREALSHPPVESSTR